MSENNTTEQVRVLIVEDEKELLELYTQWVSKYYTVETAATGKEAINKILKGTEFDVVLLDRKLPDINGRDVLTDIHRHTENCRVAVISAVKPETDILSMDFDAYVEKPVTQDKIYDVIEKLHQRTRFTEDLTKYYAIAEKIATLQTYHSDAELNNEPAYQQLLKDMKTLEEAMNHSIDFNDPSEVEQIIHDAVNKT